MAQVNIHPGICGFVTVIQATADEEQQVQVKLQSECPAIQAMEDDLQQLDGYNEVLSQWGSSTVFQSAAKHCHHAACPVPSAILKGIEVACQLALPKTVTMEITKDS